MAALEDVPDQVKAAEKALKKLSRTLLALAEAYDDEEEAAELFDTAHEYANGALTELDEAESRYKTALRELGEY